MTNNMKAHIYGLINEIAAAEKITRAKLAILSRDLLTYVMDTKDVDALNRLCQVLTPMNRKLAFLYFAEFLPWKVEEDEKGDPTRFGKMIEGKKKIDRINERRANWLADENNNIWLWGKENTDLKKKKNFVGMIEKAIEKALKGDEETDTPALTQAEVVATVIKAGVDIDTLLEGVEVKMKEQEEAEQLMAEPIAQAA